MDILGICSIALDTISKVDHLPIVDSFCTVLSTEKHQGGSGANVMIQASKMAAKIGIITKIATDADSDEILKNLHKYSIDTRGVYRQSGPYSKPSCLIYVDPNGEKTLVLDKPSALPEFTAEEAQLDLINETNVVYVDLSPARLGLKAAKFAKQQGKKVVLNIQDNMETVRSRHITDQELVDTLQFVDVFAPSQEGIKGLSSEQDTEGQLKFIRQYYKGLIILTLGTKGLVALDEQNHKYVLPALKVKAVDTTGAGDSFIGTFMATYLIHHEPLEQALKFSTASAALTCTKIGAQASPTNHEVVEFLKN